MDVYAISVILAIKRGFGIDKSQAMNTLVQRREVIRYQSCQISLLQSINQSCISGLFHFILLPDHSWQIIEINQGTNIGKPVFMDDPRKSFAS